MALAEMVPSSYPCQRAQCWGRVCGGEQTGQPLSPGAGALVPSRTANSKFTAVNRDKGASRGKGCVCVCGGGVLSSNRPKSPLGAGRFRPLSLSSWVVVQIQRESREREPA